MEIMSNKTYSETIKIFKVSCEIAGVEPTTRQASKFQRKTGLAYACKDKAKSKAYKR